MINETVHEIKEYRPTNHRRRFFHWIRLFARRGYHGGKKIKDRHDLRSFIRGTTLISLSLSPLSSVIGDKLYDDFSLLLESRSIRFFENNLLRG